MLLLKCAQPTVAVALALRRLAAIGAKAAKNLLVIVLLVATQTRRLIILPMAANATATVTRHRAARARVTPTATTAYRKTRLRTMSAPALPDVQRLQAVMNMGSTRTAAAARRQSRQEPWLVQLLVL